MKKLIVGAVVAMLFSGVSSAWERPFNPDRFPSIGVSLSGQAVSGDQSYPSFPAAGKQNREDSLGMLIFDTRLPLSNSFSLDIALGSVNYTEKADETAVLNSFKFDGTGGYFRIGARYYFNHGAKSSL